MDSHSLMGAVTPASPFQGHMVGQKSDKLRRRTWAPLRTPALFYMSCITLSESPYLSGTQFPHLQNGRRKVTSLFL